MALPPLLTAFNCDSEQGVNKDEAFEGITIPVGIEDEATRVRTALAYCETNQTGQAVPGDYSENHLPDLNSVHCADFNKDGQVDMVALDGRFGAPGCTEIPSGRLLHGTEQGCQAALNWFLE